MAAGIITALPLVSYCAESDPPAVRLDEVEITATRIPEALDRVPASVTVISGDELRARGAMDLRTTLSLVAGVDAPPAGDAGPASAVPSLWGLHEFDAFLLVVDGVPWGGAFNPDIPTLDLSDVERVEVLKGAAPVVYGATAFVGVIQVIHYPAGRAADAAQVSYGSFGSLNTSASHALPSLGGWKESLAASGERERFSVDAELINNVKLLYRGAGLVGGGVLRLDTDLASQHIRPNTPIPSNLDSGPNNSDGLNPAIPLDANYEPADGRINEVRLHGVLGYDHTSGLGDWSSTASFAHSHVRDVRGFLTADVNAMDPDNSDNGEPSNAQYQNQNRGVIDSYLETHLTTRILKSAQLVYGADLLYGSAHQSSLNGGYCAGGSLPPFNCPPDQSGPKAEPTTARPLDTDNIIDDRRAFFGQYAQLDWQPNSDWDVNGGLRLNETHERNTSFGTGDTDGVPVYQSMVKTKLSGAVGASYKAWSAGRAEAVLFADYRNTFKPAAIDFGPDVPTPNILNPEKARSYEAGLKGHAVDGKLDYELETFFMHFDNLVEAGGLNETGRPEFYNAGSELFRGIELETRYRLRSDLSLTANYSYHLARFAKNVVADSSSPTGEDNYSGLQQFLSPRSLGSLGLLYSHSQGFFGNTEVVFVGNRYLDPANTTTTPSYITLDAAAGYRFGRYIVSVHGYNLSDRRNPATNSEFGNSSYYLLPSRRVFGNATFSF